MLTAPTALMTTVRDRGDTTNLCLIDTVCGAETP
jgi:hypothetical protein